MVLEKGEEMTVLVFDVYFFIINEGFFKIILLKSIRNKIHLLVADDFSSSQERKVVRLKGLKNSEKNL